MGQEISHHRFSQSDFLRFKTSLRQETLQLAKWFGAGHFTDDTLSAGFELECWLIDKKGYPSPTNQRLLTQAGDPLLSPELAKFNIEMNVTPQPLTGGCLRQLYKDIRQIWTRSRHIAQTFNTDLTMIGILPTVRDIDLNLDNISEYERYLALNEQVLRGRGGEPISLDIVGVEHLHSLHRDVMLESAATSFQVHLQVPLPAAIHYFNAAQILAAPLVAASANSPFLFGKDLWDETRIPLFEQAVAVGGYDAAAFGPVRRVTFGGSYVRESMMELFHENLQHYPVLLPVDLTEENQPLPHLRLHNGTIWRWNRPLIGFNEQGIPHLRIEHRVIPAGPTHLDALANAALFYGLITDLVRRDADTITAIPFSTARDNFYHAARYGLEAQLVWYAGTPLTARNLILQQLMPSARRGLEQLGIDRADITDFLDIISARVNRVQNGSTWQRRFVNVHGRDMQALTLAYMEHQHRESPVHDWAV